MSYLQNSQHTKVILKIHLEEPGSAQDCTQLKGQKEESLVYIQVWF